MVTTVLTGAKRAVCYRRVSSTGQTGERHSSLETQESQYLQYCDSRNYIPIKTFEDVISGRRDDRRDYLRMVDFVKQGGADVVVVQFLDRFGRNPKEILRRYWDLEDHGVSVEATDEDKFKIVAELSEHFKRSYETIDIDGARVLFGDGWGLVRASNTQPVLVLRFEARSKERLAEIIEIFKSKLREYPSVKFSDSDFEIA